MSKIHELKSWVGLFEPILEGRKTHDVRVLDRDFQVGDICILKEWEPTKREYTGREVKVEITYITSAQHQACAFSPFVLHPASGILSIKKISDEQNRERKSLIQYKKELTKTLEELKKVKSYTEALEFLLKEEI